MILKLFNIEISSSDTAHTGKTDIKIKITDELKGYNKFKLINLDEDNNFEVNDIVELKVDGEYLVGTLPHLSVYAMVAEGVEENPSEEQNIEENKPEVENNTENPKTGDIGIGIWIGLIAVSTIGLAVTFIVTKKKKIIINYKKSDSFD